MSEAKWVQVQKRTFTKWFNNHLRKKGYKTIENIATDWASGIMLMRVVNALYSIPMPRKYNKRPKLRPHKLDNLTLAMNMLENKAEVKTNFLKNTHLLDGDEKMILGMMWAIILHYAINAISVDDLTAKEGLLLWVQKKTAGYAGVDPPKVRNFHRDWKSGLAFCALVHKHHPELIDYDNLDHKDNETNLNLAFDAAETLGIPRLLEPEDLMTDKPDERSVMTYVSEFFHAFASSNLTEAALRRANKFLAFARAMEERENEYERRASIVSEWIISTSDKFSDTDFGTTLEEAKSALEYFREYIVVEKPPKLGELLDLMSLLAEIQSELKVNGRPAYVPPEGLTPLELDGAFESLSKVEDTYAQGARANRFAYVNRVESGLSDEQLDEYKASFSHFDSNANGYLNAQEFRAALMVVNVPFRDDDAFMRVYNEHKVTEEGVDLDNYIAFMYDLSADLDTAEQVKESFQTLAGGDMSNISEAQLSAFTAEDADFIRSHAEANDDGSYNFASFVDANYA